MIKAGPNTTTSSNTNSSNTNNTTSKTTTNSNKPLNGQSSNNKTETKTNSTNDPKLDEVTSEDENLTNYEKYINKRNKTLQTNCPLILSISGNTTGTSGGVTGLNASTSGSGRPIQTNQVQFDSSKLNPETLQRVCKGLNLNTSGLSLKQIYNKLDKFWVNEYKPDPDFILAKSLLKVKYDMGLESKDFNSVFDSEDEFQYFGHSSELGQSDNDDSSEYYNNNNDASANNQRTKRPLPTDGRQGTRVKKRLHYYNIADDPEPQLDEIYQNPLDYLTNFSNNRNFNESEDNQEINEDENNDSALDSKTPTNIDEKTPKDSNTNNNQVYNLREESNYMIEYDTQENELEELEHHNDGSQLNTSVDTKTVKNDQEVFAEDKDHKEEIEDQEPSKEQEAIKTEPEEPVKAAKEQVNCDPKETEPEEERDLSPNSEKEDTKDDSLEDVKSPVDPESASEDHQKTSSPTPIGKSIVKSPTPHDQSSPLPELTDPPTPGQQDAIPQEDGEIGEEAETEEEEVKNTNPDYKSTPIGDNDLDFTSDISDLTNPESP